MYTMEIRYTHIAHFALNTDQKKNGRHNFCHVLNSIFHIGKRRKKIIRFTFTLVEKSGEKSMEQTSIP